MIGRRQCSTSTATKSATTWWWESGDVGGKVFQRQQQRSSVYVAPNSMCVAPSQQHGQQLAKQQQQRNRAEGLLEAFSYQDICNTYSIYKRILNKLCQFSSDHHKIKFFVKCFFSSFWIFPIFENLMCAVRTFVNFIKPVSACEHTHCFKFNKNSAVSNAL